MSILENLETSYNRQVQKQILEQMRIIDAAEEKYLSEKNKYKQVFMEKSHPIIINLNREKALSKGYYKDYRDALKNLRQEYLNNLADLKENRGFNINEEKQNVSLLMAKIDSNYQKARKEYLQAIKAGQMDAVKKLNDFEQAFKIYREQELTKRTTERDINIGNINEQYSQGVNKLKEEYQRNIKDLKEKHQLTNRITFKREKKKLINSYKNEIAKLKQEKKVNEVNNYDKLKMTFNEYQVIKKTAKTKIKEINAEVKAKVAQMPIDKRNEYYELQKYIEEDYRVLRLKKIDEREKKLLGRINPAYIYVAPAFFGALFFTLLPFAFMIIGSFFRVDFANLSKSRWVGLQNFINIFTKDVEFQKAIVNTAVYAFITIVLLTVVTVSMAAWLAKNTRIHNVAQTMVFTPHIASLVSISILWIAMLNPSGIINQGLALFGIKGPAWLLQENTSLLSVSLVTVWKDIGYYVLIIIAGLQGIPTYVYEAAKLDKASKSTTFFKITLPLLAPTMSFVFLTKFINSFKVFAPIEIMTNGGPMGSSMVLSYWIYKVGRIGFNYGQAMAGAIVLTIMIALTTALKNIYFDKTVKY